MREAITLTVSPSENDDNPTQTLDPVTLEHSESGVPEAIDAHPLQAGAPVEPESPTFAEFGVRPEIVRALAEAGIERTFAIQALTLPLAMAGDDLIGQARTGMGKTLGFGVPLLQRLQIPGDGTPQVLVVVPTRELCVQVANDLKGASKHLKVSTLAIYGGRPYDTQIEALKKGVDVVIGTPGRLLDLAERGALVLGKIRGLVLDEADEMLDLGFLPDIERILRMVPEKRQTMLFSATMPGPIITLARTFLTQPTHIRAEENDASAIHERTTQFVYRAHSMDKPELVARALQAKDRGLTMIFTRTKRTAQKVADDLAERGFAAAAVHGDLGQGAREQALRAFRAGKVDVLVATDVAARGIDVDDVTHVFNYQTPDDEKTYVHRIGRTGRAGKTGVAITLVDWDEMPRWKLISDTLGLDKPEPVETYSSSKHLFSDLEIPEGASGRLPLSQRTRAGLAAEHEEDLGMKRRGRGQSEPVAPAAKTRARAPRRRTRGGGGDAEGTPADDAQATTSTESNGTAPAESGEGSRSRGSRRRTRGGPKPSGEAAAGPAEKESGDNVERPARRRRRRSGASAGSGSASTGTESAGTAD
ncbi:MAG: ATP-dependent helicase [Amycolatopsis sp.]|jgi:superfamily II DNA/RNA helicase|uniref:DEAD/DEAH box helicase n=1 Tax=Amycolatopsis sp. TaxID=37632 RepID=UPI00263580C0|nr:DEAD/DEAH box helicase [Amycolatopsis sp.]MCU1682107.1 ATP-dependent helicase [Amycolatopsis sp.]